MKKRATKNYVGLLYKLNTTIASKVRWEVTVHVHLILYHAWSTCLPLNFRLPKFQKSRLRGLLGAMENVHPKTVVYQVVPRKWKWEIPQKPVDLDQMPRKIKAETPQLKSRNQAKEAIRRPKPPLQKLRLPVVAVCMTFTKGMLAMFSTHEILHVFIFEFNW